MLPRVSKLRLLIITIVSVVAAALVGGLVVALLASELGVALLPGSESQTTGVAQRQSLRLVLLLNNLVTFGLSAILALWWVYGRQYWPRAAGLTGGGGWQRLLWPAVGAFVLAMPLISLSAYLNLQLELPEWAFRGEEQSNAVLRRVLTFESTPELLFALVTIAVVPGLSEELMFRGLVQRRLFGGGHLAVWGAAVLFSAIHLEFAGFLPRLLLGALLGYAYRWTATLWVPIILHMLFNGIQVIGAYVSGFSPDTEVGEGGWTTVVPGLISLLLVAALIRFAETRYRAHPDEEPSPPR